MDVHSARHSGRVSCLHALGVALLLLAPATVATAQECTAWPGEVTPLPTTQSTDPFGARWAELRVRELEKLASALEAEDPGNAYRVWKHIGCLDPERANVVKERLRPTIVVAARPVRKLPPPAPRVPAPRPAPTAPVVAEKQPEAPAEPPLVLDQEIETSAQQSESTEIDLGSGLVDVAARPTAAIKAPTPMPEPTVDLTGVDALLREAQDVLIEARFRDVIDATDLLRTQLRSMGTSRGVMERRARIEIMAATAQIALGRAADAAQSFARALEADPELELSEATPPKIRRMLEEVRSERRGEERP